MADLEKPIRGSKAGKAESDKKRIKAIEERRAQAIELRKAGMTYRQIAEEIGYADASSAQKAVQEGLKEVLLDAGAEDVINLELARLDEYTLQVFAILRDEDASYDQKLRALDRALMIAERRARYLGLDAPEKIDMNVHGSAEHIHVVRIEGDSEDYIKSLQEARQRVLQAAHQEGISPSKAEMEIIDAVIIEDDEVTSFPAPTVVDREMAEREGDEAITTKPGVHVTTSEGSENDGESPSVQRGADREGPADDEGSEEPSEVSRAGGFSRRIVFGGSSGSDEAQEAQGS